MMVQNPVLDSTDSRNNPYPICKELSKRIRQTTPDFLERKLEHHIPIFTYGTLQNGGANSHILKGSKWLGDGITLFKTYEVYETASGTFPIALELSKQSMNVTRGKIAGEVYMVDPKTLLALDDLEGNGSLYQRKKIWVTLLDQTYPIKGGKFAHPQFECWCYFGMPKQWQGRNISLIHPRGKNKEKVYCWNPVRNKMGIDQTQFRVFPGLDDDIPF